MDSLRAEERRTLQFALAGFFAMAGADRVDEAPAFMAQPTRIAGIDLPFLPGPRLQVRRADAASFKPNADFAFGRVRHGNSRDADLAACGQSCGAHLAAHVKPPTVDRLRR